MDNGGDKNNIIHDTIRNDVRQSGDDQLARALNSSQPSAQGEMLKPQCRFHNCADYPRGCLGAVFRNMLPDRCQAVDRAFAEAGKPVYAECGGMIYLGGALTTLDGRSHAMAGVLPTEFEMTPRLVHFGYVYVELAEQCLLGEKGTEARGHSFHCSRVRTSSSEPTAYRLKYTLSGREEIEGYRYKNVLASYVHLHFRGNSALAASLVREALKARVRAVEVQA